MPNPQTITPPPPPPPPHGGSAGQTNVCFHTPPGVNRSIIYPAINKARPTRIFGSAALFLCNSTSEHHIHIHFFIN